MTYDERLQKFHTDDLLPSEERLQNPILMTRHYLDLGSASDWPYFNQSEAIPRIWVVTRHQYGISAIVY